MQVPPKHLRIELRQCAHRGDVKRVRPTRIVQQLRSMLDLDAAVGQMIEGGDAIGVPFFGPLY